MRFVTEMVDFMTVKSAKDDEMQGRTSGSMKWRQLRGEAGAQPANKVSTLAPGLTRSHQWTHLVYIHCFIETPCKELEISSISTFDKLFQVFILIVIEHDSFSA